MPSPSSHPYMFLCHKYYISLPPKYIDFDNLLMPSVAKFIHGENAGVMCGVNVCYHVTVPDLEYEITF